MNRFLLVQKVLSGVAKEDEKRELEQWIAQGYDNIEEFEHLKLLWNHMNNPEVPATGINIHSGFSNIQRTLKSRVRHNEQ